MKKIILALAALAVSAGIMSAQDMATATETYNNGAEALSLGDKAAALGHFQNALKIGLACGEEGAELVSNCKNIIPGIILSMGKELYNGKNFDAALEKFKEAGAVAKEYGNVEVAEEAEALIPQVNILKDLEAANDAFALKDMPAAAEGYKKVLAADSTNSVASIRLIQCLAGAGDMEGARQFLKYAEANGQGKNASKVIGGTYLKQALADLKAGKFAEAVAAAKESNLFDESASAYQIAGQAATKLNNNAEAIGYFEKYLELAPKAKNAGQIALTVGALYQGQKNNAKAIEFYNKAQAAGVDASAYIKALGGK